MLAACLVAWERPALPWGSRIYEFIWTTDPEVVREAARQCCELVGRDTGDLVDDLRERLADAPEPATASRLRTTVELATRIAMYVSGDEDYLNARALVPRPRRRPR